MGSIKKGYVGRVGAPHRRQIAGTHTMANTSATQHNRRVLPVAGWLQVGAAAAGIGIALAAAPAAAADTETGSSTSGSVSISARSAPSNGQTAQRRAATRERPALSTADRWATTALSTAERWATTASSGATRAAAAIDRPSRSSSVRHAASAPADVEVPDSDTIATAAAPTPPPAVRSTPASRIRTGVTAPADAAALNTAALPTASATADSTLGNFFGDVAAFFGLPGAPATTAPTIAALPLFTRLVIDDILGGSTPPTNLDPTTAITGLFQEIMRKDPTAGELQSYSALWNLTGVNGVVAGLYSSTAFRQNQVDTYYLELLGRTATQAEKSWGASSLIWGLPETLLAASITSSREYSLTQLGNLGYYVPEREVDFKDLAYVGGEFDGVKGWIINKTDRPVRVVDKNNPEATTSAPTYILQPGRAILFYRCSDMAAREGLLPAQGVRFEFSDAQTPIPQLSELELRDPTAGRPDTIFTSPSVGVRNVRDDWSEGDVHEENAGSHRFWIKRANDGRASRYDDRSFDVRDWPVFVIEIRSIV